MALLYQQNKSVRDISSDGFIITFLNNRIPDSYYSLLTRICPFL